MAARYWRVDQFTVTGGAGFDLAIYALELYSLGSAVSNTVTLNCNKTPTAGTLAELQDGSNVTGATFAAADVATLEFIFDAGAGAALESDAIKFVVNGVDNYPASVRVSWSNDAVSWIIAGQMSNLTANTSGISLYLDYCPPFRGATGTITESLAESTFTVRIANATNGTVLKSVTTKTNFYGYHNTSTADDTPLMITAYADHGSRWRSSVTKSLTNLIFPSDPAVGHYYECEVAGTTGATEPVWPTNGGTVVDGTVTWRDKGQVVQPVTQYPLSLARMPGGGLVTDGLVFILDAGFARNFANASDQLWRNSVPSPADGSAASAYNFYRGVDGTSETTDPTFTGTINNGISATQANQPYFSFSLTAPYKFFTLAAATAFLKSLHKAGAKFTFEVFLYAGTALTDAPIFDSGTGFTATDVHQGVQFCRYPALFKNGVLVAGDTGGSPALQKFSDATVTGSTFNYLAASIDGTGAQASFLYRNGAYDPVGGQNTWDGTFVSPSTVDPPNLPRIGIRGDAAAAALGTARIYFLRLYNRNLTKAELDQNFNAQMHRMQI